MRWWKRIDWKEIGIRLGMVAVLFVLCAIALLPQITDYSLRVKLRQDRTGYNTQLYWWDAGTEHSQEQSFLALIDGKQVSIPIQKGMLGWNKEWRLDIIDANLEVGITAFELYKGQEKRKTISADELEEYVTDRAGVEDTYSTGEDFFIKPLNHDPSVDFGTNICRSFVRHIVLHYLLKMMVVGCLLLVVVFFDRLPIGRKLYALIWKLMEDNRWAFVGFAVLLAGIIGLVFHDFILGDQVFVYMGDSFYQTYAELVHTADRIAAGEWGSGYTFFKSLGNAEGPVVLTLKNFFTVFGREHVAVWMGIAQMLKIFLAGIFFYAFLREMGTGKQGSCLLGIGYGFSSYLIARGMWQSYPNEAVIFALWLLGFEWLKNRNRRVAFFLISAFCYWNYNGYSAVFYTGVSIVYIVFRYLSERDESTLKELEQVQQVQRQTEQELQEKTDKQQKNAAKTTVRGILQAALLTLGGAVVSAWAWFPTMWQMLGSSRVSQGAQSAGSSSSLLDFTSLEGYRTMFYRLIGNDILGMLDDTYAGASSWLEDPVYYCGLIAVLTVPLGLWVMKGKKRGWYLFALAGAAVYNVWGFLRYMVNGFAGSGWKLSSLWVVVLLLMIAAEAWRETDQSSEAVRVEKTQIKKKGKVLISTNAVIILLSIIFIKKGVQFHYLAMSLIFCLFLSLILWKSSKEEDAAKKRYLKYILLLTASVEIICASYRVVNNKAVLNTEVLEEKVFYNDSTTDLLAEAEDENDFYRVDKQFVSASYCDSLYQRYMGAASYIGGVGDNEYSKQFFERMGLPELQHVQKGTEQNTVVDALLNVRYVLAKNWQTNTFGLEYLKESEGIWLYENPYALPFGYVYDEYIKESDFGFYVPIDRRNIMLSRCVLADEEVAGFSSSIAENPSYDVFLNRWKDAQSECTVDEEDDLIEFDPIQEGEMVVLRVKIRAQEVLWANGYYMQNDAVTGKFNVRMINGEDEYFIECLTAGTDCISIRSDGRYPHEIVEAQLYRIPQKEYYADYIVQTQERSRNHLEITEFQEESITGVADMTEAGIMVFTIPYDAGWTAYVDGEEQKLLHANIGFMGLELSAGQHEIRLEYE